MKYILYLISFIFISTGINLKGEQLSLSDAIKRGLKNNYQIRISNENTKIAENNNSWGLAGRYPSLNLGLNSANSINNDPSTTNPTERTKFNSFVLSPSLSLNWVLFRGFSVSITKNKLDMLNKISIETKEIIVENTIQAIILAYNKVILEKEKMKITQKLYELSRDRYNYVLSKKEYGLAVSTDVLNAKIAYLSDKANIISQKMNIKNAKRNLNLVLGEKVNKDILISENLKSKNFKFVLKALKKELLNDNKNLKNQYINQEILKNEIKLNHSSYYPTVSLNSGLSMNRIGLKFPKIPLSSSSSYDYYVNFSISMNLFNGGNTKRAIANARINEKIGLLKLSELKLSLENRLTGFVDLYYLRKELLEISKENVKNTKLNLELAFDRFKSGVITSFNYRDIQIQYFNTAYNKLQSIFNLIDTGTEILRLTGSLVSEYISPK